MNKRHLHHLWRYFRAVKPYYFLGFAIILGVVAVAQLRANNQHMLKLRDAVYQADQANGDVTKALNNLRQYVNGHMNTNLVTGNDSVYPPIQLKYTYERLVKAESDKVASTNSELYTAAQSYCQQLYPDSFSGGPRVPCITDYVNSHGAKVTPIPDALYKFSFATPTWSPDLAGWCIVLTVFSSLLCIISFVVDRWFKHFLR